MIVDTNIQLRQELLDKMDNEEVLTQEELWEFLEFRAALMGLEIEDALRQTRDDTLPHSLGGIEFRALARLLTSR